MSLNHEQTDRRAERPLDRRTRESGTQQIYDLVCVGFGTTALSVASSLADSSPQARILFVERESQFTWNPEHILPDAPIGSNFLRDLTTTQNPRSEFTFVNFLQKTDQLIRFTNNSRMAPTRRLMAQYFKWAADRIKQRGWLSYSQEAVQVKPVKISVSNRVTQWTLDLRNSKSGALSTVQSKRIILATGAEPHIMAPLAGPQLEPLVLHSSGCTGLLERLGSLKQTLNVAIVGADQEAVEIFNHLHTARGKHTASLFYADSALRPEDHTANISDMINRPGSNDSVPPEIRSKLQSVEVHHSPKVDLDILESLYEAQYTQKIHEADASKWRFQMRPLSEVVAAKREGNRVRLVTRNNRTGEVGTTATAFDVIISATGYEHSANMKLVSPVAPLLDAGALTVDREYKVNFRRDTISRGCGMWLLGSLEDLKERGDSFGLMAERARRTVQSVQSSLKEKSDEQYSEAALL
ncbi:Putative L-lysine 6-monooxygenase/L-ornithine 5-monooxygenase, FAD/NAD(P)-binding domain superfamily [Septoria linicola]|uniref:L-ornithine N(5)-monooxygenase [NAD(P)H] n=1 Tax=Septoria linicola TaxID=215465 RepID=A0A9Q9EQM5_9PEZI|nr:putative L-lysine 6-monooxygenase/L-ornithine 5-monooxygenase, FAD/NAD(P)-binding domain superfamily [Septoria linicola]USW59280.1 Putative L-lysine 6-monooxygenase/L-ornithine 5-monooxygenase, FAD/NAD(P)-binding domain superfamily [Septoria linicola]